MLIGASVILFLISLTQKGYCVNRTGDFGTSGLGLLLLGWVAIFDGMIAWCANPLILISWISMEWPRLRIVSIAAAVLALLAALSFLRHKDILVDEGGGRAPIARRGPGYWLWIASTGTQLINATISVMVHR